MHRLAVGAAGLAAEAAVERLLRVGAEVRPAELDHLARAEVGRERLHDAAAPERQPQRRPERRDLVGRGLDHLLLASGAVEVRLGRVEPVLPDAGVDRAPGGRPCAAAPSRSASRATSRSARRSRTGSRTCSRGSAGRHVDVDASDRVDQLLEAVEVDEGDVVDVEPGEALHRLQRQHGPADLRRGVDLRRSRSRGCRRAGRAGSRGTRAGGLLGSVRMSMIESARCASLRPGCVPPSVPSTRIVVGVDVEHPVLALQLARAPASGRARSRPRCRAETER